ncbi:YebC/PmpR family DNA-binding transcriptional regulator [Facklamia miroungae]|uniref:Probable transcriptional regulatory protein SAMN05421791_102125 n=1 Tax=Facklamia miroungae TaxID=120956 RepID=A0A1G7QKJ4_9LACT|nr:YebC/PmpR family DNA-binding transcriptional regulator [Facklamia miroungae]NKZ28976.1 YebC/PmpR family DNA-binding transcriptional regulator [Facklamia miroungae]SDF99067.1 DNA-binding regulatory protein, YebC/PmpR family [Facklamia miroungae]
MAGHSKWNNIKNRKGAQDAKRGKLFQKLSREIYMAAKQGGGDPDTNPALRLAMDKAKANNMPNDNVERAINKATSSAEGENYAEVVYEGFGPQGVAILTETLTDNRNRTMTNVRIAYNKNGGNLGESGTVNYMFDRKGYLVLERSKNNLDEEEMLMFVMEAGGEDLETSEEVFEVYTDPSELAKVRDSLQAKKLEIHTAELTLIPKTWVTLPEEDFQILSTIVAALEDDDDVSEVYHNGQLAE